VYVACRWLDIDARSRPGVWFGFALRCAALFRGVFVRLHLALFPAGGPFLSSLSVCDFYFVAAVGICHAVDPRAQELSSNVLQGTVLGPDEVTDVSNSLEVDYISSSSHASELAHSHGSTIEFYLTPAKTSQGCV
jgi:hypothetical protein